jgi:hypothetical protein
MARKAKVFGLQNVQLRKGHFEHTLAEAPETRFSFVPAATPQWMSLLPARSESLQVIPLDNYEKYYIVKEKETVAARIATGY